MGVEARLLRTEPEVYHSKSPRSFAGAGQRLGLEAAACKVTNVSGPTVCSERIWRRTDSERDQGWLGCRSALLLGSWSEEEETRRELLGPAGLKEEQSIRKKGESGAPKASELHFDVHQLGF